ncbi:hypothetical protein CO046_00360 [Candidatus Peregrinibacteria bacterium CG_4_9_14_0_2_um_filter_53_11]|nr:MAG: hypothetical protein CO046_00360 [Candidatus Peregrinibacteria bacterium CG_4_9_14_0_2_um_filter_53_11]
MVDPKTYIQEGLKTIKTLIEQNHLITALRAGEELARVNPYDRKVLNALANIQALIQKENEANVDRDIASTMHLWDEGKFDELQKIYSKLYQFSPQHKRLRALIIKLNEQMNEGQKKEHDEFIDQAVEAIKNLISEKNYTDAIQAGNELLQYDPLNSAAQKLLKKAKTGLIDMKLTENSQLLESADFERALEFYESLRRIDPDHSVVNRLSQQTKAHIAEKKLLASKITLNESIARMKELFTKREYEKVLQACDEIESIDPGNWTGRSYKKKAQATIERESDSVELKQLTELWKTMAPQVKEHPENYTRL